MYPKCFLVSVCGALKCCLAIRHSFCLVITLPLCPVNLISEQNVEFSLLHLFVFVCVFSLTDDQHECLNEVNTFIVSGQEMVLIKAIVESVRDHVCSSLPLLISVFVCCCFFSCSSYIYYHMCACVDVCLLCFCLLSSIYFTASLTTCGLHSDPTLCLCV